MSWLESNYKSERAPNITMKILVRLLSKSIWIGDKQIDRVDGLFVR